MKKVILIFCFSLFALFVGAQDSRDVYFKRTAYPIYSWTKKYQQPFEHDTIPGEHGKYRQIDNYKIIAADYSDNDTKFAIAINVLQKFPGEGGMMYAPYATDPGNYQFYVAPYLADSIYVMPCNPRNAQITPLQPFIIAAGDKEFKCTLSKDLKSVSISPLNDKWINPKFKLYNNLLPIDTFQAIGKNKHTFQEFENKNKYIYVLALEFDYYTKKPEIDGNLLKDVNEKFKDRLTTIIFVPDSIEWKNSEIGKGYEGIVSTLMYFPGCDFEFNFSPNGVLFNGDGTIANKGILPSDLKEFLEKLTQK